MAGGWIGPACPGPACTVFWNCTESSSKGGQAEQSGREHNVVIFMLPLSIAGIYVDEATRDHVMVDISSECHCCLRRAAREESQVCSLNGLEERGL